MHLRFYPQIPGLVSRGIFQLRRSVGFTAVGQKGGLAWSPNKSCLSACLAGVPPAPEAQLQHVLWRGLWYVEFVGGEALFFRLLASWWCWPCSPGAPWLVPIPGHAEGPGACAFLLACMKDWARPIPEGSRNIHSVAANHLCAICLWNRSLRSG